ncbi:hypothetical protein HAX54_024461 [Datura stramonium]|uniref:Uncharacterized protein n=1 Tax=Datura stramonium TaxID=4076 RepID=A0ABS8UY07_DATST|nr:hypothetical protein [Datura stramonium]
MEFYELAHEEEEPKINQVLISKRGEGHALNGVNMDSEGRKVGETPRLALAIRRLALAIRRLTPVVRKWAPTIRRLAPVVHRLASAIRRWALAVHSLASVVHSSKGK